MNHELSEDLLTAWLRLSTSIIGSRIVSELSYKESLVCNLLYRNSLKQDGKPLTATDLCIQTNMLKSQMNRILNALEEKQVITRKRSPEDGRRVLITMNPLQSQAYYRQHQHILDIMNTMILRLGEEEAFNAVRLLNRISDIAHHMQLGQ
ncbi:MAG: winged helix-turn-helix transcriptional regulator [Lachnospiraceae bacterium]|nr:winged helix-turn-helix transcriptional regulator [Lachnospiraceae bacterium]